MSTLKIFRGAGIVFLGSIVGLGLKLLAKMIITRSVTVSEFGVYSLASVIFSIALVVSLLGMEEGVPRQVAYEEEPSKTVGSSIIVALFSGTTVAAFLFIFSTYIADLFKEGMLDFVIKVFSIALPFSVLSSTMLANFRGFEMPEIKVCLGDVLKNSVFVVTLLLLYLTNPSLSGVLMAFVLATLVSFISLTYTFIRRIDYSFDLSAVPDLLRFSIPLLLAIMLGMVMAWTDTIMIGYFESARDVGLYSAAQTLAALLPVFLSSAGYMFVPVASKALSKGESIGKMYRTTTKWIFVVTVPFFAILMLHPKFVLNLFFGNDYSEAGIVLEVLALGFMFHVALGLNGASLIVFGGGRYLMYMTLVGAVCNVVLNLVLIPVYGILGAGMATTASYVLANSVASLKLYRISRIHPFGVGYLKVLVPTICALTLRSFPLFIVVLVVATLLSIEDYDRELFRI